jgi:[protein-PII] uridylyltransferase
VPLDHSVRTVREACAVADRDLKAALGLLDARVVAGDGELGESLVRRVHKEWLDRAPTRLEAFGRLVDERHHSSADVAYALEPNLKEGKGGSRDLAALRVLAMVSPVAPPDARLEPAAQAILEARVALQRHHGRTDHLLLEYQDDVASDLGDLDADALMARLSAAARTIAWQSDESWRSVRSWLQGPRGRSSAAGDTPIGPGLVLRDGEVALLADAEIDVDPSLVLRAAASAAYLGVPIAPAALRTFDSETVTVGDPWAPATREAFVSLLGGGHAAIAQIELLDRHGVLVRYLPEWETVRSHSQRNAFHRFTVDRHLLETVAQACEHVREVRRPDLLLVGALLHDLGKGTPGDHTEVGIVLAREVAQRMGFEPADVAVLVEMVRHHLLLPSFATGRDLDDPATIESVARAVQTEETLDLLHALTRADSSATGPTAWSPWKAELVRQLVDRTRARLVGEGRGSSGATPVPEPDRAAVLAVERFDGDLLIEPSASGVTIVVPDAVGLLAIEVAVLGVHAQGVRSARTYTIGDVAVGEFDVEPERGRVVDWTHLAEDLRAALQDPEPVRERLQARAQRYGKFTRPTAARPAEPRVLVDNELTPAATIVEVRAADGIGVLYRITSAIARLGIRVDRAFVSTLGHEVADTFYVTGEDGTKITDPARVTALETEVLAALHASDFVQGSDQVR